MSPKGPDITFDYGEESDVLFISFGTNEPSFTEEVDDLICVERGMFTSHITGFRVVGIRHHRIKSIDVVIKKIDRLIERDRKQIEKECARAQKILPKLPDQIAAKLKVSEAMRAFATA